MKLWWLMTHRPECSYAQLKQRGCLAIYWKDLGSLERYIRVRNGWERQLKTYIQVKGDVVFGQNPKWRKDYRELDQVPQAFMNFLSIKAGDLVIALEAGAATQLGRTEAFGVAEVTQDTLNSYRYDDRFDYAHCGSHGLIWHDWDRIHFGEPKLPKKPFISVTEDNGQELERARQALDYINARSPA
ncbi:hypothetical protein [Gynuella sunshinyii]|uniref:Uncharacterized protein n=1 Tax=Gynuella sunshinyii YC6258 TaxID=1445510 RepID=A0A0C5VT18_9GAMM|nr:hypothetical protein [Gynuella sunshinyii]AJQ97331.1 hypothetical Protein YC6258_05301 [Gynuella sunshinyii YC6258]